MNNIVNQICDFVAYVDSFYSEKSGLYPIKGMTNSMVIKAVQKHIEKVGQEFYGDSLDRERVRDIILVDNGLTL